MRAVVYTGSHCACCSLREDRIVRAVVYIGSHCACCSLREDRIVRAVVLERIALCVL